MSHGSTMTADQFRAELKALQLRQIHLAEQLGVSRHTVKRWANGDLPVPKYAALVLELMAQKQAADVALAFAPLAAMSAPLQSP